MSLKSRILSRRSYTYRLRNGWGISVIRNKREMKALIDFCLLESKEYHEAGFTKSSHLPTWEKTVRLYDIWKITGNGLNELEDYIEAHVGWYWSSMHHIWILS